jgi:hypothetical protein
MPFLEYIGGVIVWPPLVVGYFAMLFGLAQVLSPERLRRIGRGLWHLQWNLWHMMIAVAVAALVILMFTLGYEIALAFILMSVFVQAWFVRVWCHEFFFLMGLRDDDFPGRHDRLIWLIGLVAFAPLSLWVFRSFRLARWPAPGPAHESQTQFHAEPPSTTSAAAQPA